MVVPLQNLHEISKTQGGQLNANFKESYRKQVLQQPCLKLLEDKKNWEGRICNVPNFALGHNGQITFSILMKFVNGIIKSNSCQGGKSLVS